MPWRKCMMCRQRKTCDIPVGGGWLCDKCGVGSGIHGRLRNVAEKNSTEWQNKPCKHPTTRRGRYKDNRGKWHQRDVCQRCKTVVWDVYE